MSGPILSQEDRQSHAYRLGYLAASAHAFLRNGRMDDLAALIVAVNIEMAQAHEAGTVAARIFPPIPLDGGRVVHMATDVNVMLDDLGALLRALELGDHARPESPHAVMLECIEAVVALKKERDEAQFSYRTTLASLRRAEGR